MVTVCLLSDCNIGAGAYIHQRIIIGNYSMVGMNNTITKNIKERIVNLLLLNTKNLSPFEKELVKHVDSIVAASGKNLKNYASTKSCCPKDFYCKKLQT